MRVLRQEWFVPSQGFITSISKDQEQVNTTFEEVKKKEGDEVTLEGESMEVEIPDNSAFAEMVERGTVFLHKDEMAVISEIEES